MKRGGAGQAYNEGNGCSVAQAQRFPLGGSQVTSEVER